MEIQSTPIVVLYEDDQFVVFDKPAGLLVIPTPLQEKNTLVNLVNAQFSSKASEYKLHPCHRLDRETSGVIIFAKGKHNQQLMMDIFEKREVKKKYIAIVQGKLPNKDGEFKGVIKNLERRRFQKTTPGKMAVTRYHVVEERRNFSVVEIEIPTGRTNQIRIQFAQSGRPLVGERKYAFGKDFELKFKRSALHAYQLEWINPVTKQEDRVTAPLAKDMELFLEKNKK